MDRFIAVSRYIARRIRRAYRRKATVIYPPVEVEAFTPGGHKDDFYVTASRMVPYKRMDLIVDAFAALPERRLIVIGDGPEAARVRSRSAPNIQLLGQQPFEVLRDHLRRARAFVFAAEEDFGIAPVEAQACGTPVIAYGKGGALETIRSLQVPEPTGIFFPHQTVSSIIDAVHRFEREGERIEPTACRENALRFGAERFRQQLGAYVRRCWHRAEARRRAPPLFSSR